MDAGLIGSVVDSKYRVEGLLGRGGMGAVFRAVHMGTDRTVALKVIVPDHAQRADFLARFEREARACGRLRHPNIVDVTDFGYAEVGGKRLAYLVMEYLDGCALADVLRDDKPLPIPWVVDVLEQVGSALEEAHRAGILHRDLKPDNIWLEPNRRGGYTIKVLDFGLAKLAETDAEPASAPAEVPAPPVPPAVGDETEEATQMRPALPSTLPLLQDSNATAMGSIIGTPAYMSPEQCRGQALTPRSDVYSLGVIAYRLLAGVLPFSGSPAAQIAAHVSQTPRPIRELRRDLPKSAADLVMLGLAKTAEQRPPSAGAFAGMLAARAQTGPEFIKEALLLFLEHARAFLSVSIVGMTPVLLLAFFAVINAIAFVYGHAIVPRRVGAMFVSSCILMTVGPGMVLVQGAVVPAVMQAVVSPLQPIDVKTLRRRFRPRFHAYLRGVMPILGIFVLTGLWQVPALWFVRMLRPIVEDDNQAVAVLGAILTVLLPNLPLLVILALFSTRSGSARGLQFLGAVAVVEGLPPKEAALRATQLSKGVSQRALRFLMISLGMAMGVVGGFVFALLARRMPPQVAMGALALLFALAFVLMGPFFAVVNSLTYLRARRAMGEPLDKALAEFEHAVLPESHWKLAERERVATLIASRW